VKPSASSALRAETESLRRELREMREQLHRLHMLDLAEHSERDLATPLN
jgi:hypothetical protein